MSVIIIIGGGDAKAAIDSMVEKSVHGSPADRAAAEAFLAFVAAQAKHFEALFTPKP